MSADSLGMYPSGPLVKFRDWPEDDEWGFGLGS